MYTKLNLTQIDLTQTGSFSGSFSGSFIGTLTGTGSYSVQSLSASYATTASYALNGGGTGASFPYTGSAQITGSLGITGSLSISQSLFQYADNTDVDTGTETILSIETGSYCSAFFDYVAVSGSNARSGTVITVWNQSNVEYTEASTNDIGDTLNCNLQVILSGANIVLQSRVLSDNWSIKALARLL